MSKRAAIAKATGTNVDASEHAILGSKAVIELARQLSAAIISTSDGRRKNVSHTGCAQLALQVLVVAAGLRRAALVDALGLTAAQASAISLKLGSLSKQVDSDSLQKVRLLHHAPTSQTFIVSRRQSLWSDLGALTGGATSNPQSPVLWVDARLSSEHTAPSLVVPDAHITSLLVAVHEAIANDDSKGVLVASGAPKEPSSSDDEAQLVGVALAGFLLEYGAIYCLHDISSDDATKYRYDTRPPDLVEGTIIESDFVASPPNCLGSQPLIVYKVLWSSPHSSDKFELLSFSVPQCLSTDSDVEHLRQTLIDTFQTRANGVSNMFSSGTIAVEVATVSLTQIAL